MNKSTQRNEKHRAEEAKILDIITPAGPTNALVLVQKTGLESNQLSLALRRLINRGVICRIAMDGNYGVYELCERAEAGNDAETDKGYQPRPGVRVVSCNDHAHPKPFVGLNAPRITGWGQSSLA